MFTVGRLLRINVWCKVFRGVVHLILNFFLANVLTSAALGPYCSQFTSRGRPIHHRALAAAIRQVPPDWKRPTGRPTTLGSMQLRQTLAFWTLASRLPGERPILPTINWNCSAIYTWSPRDEWETATVKKKACFDPELYYIDELTFWC